MECCTCRKITYNCRYFIVKLNGSVMVRIVKMHVFVNVALVRLEPVLRHWLIMDSGDCYCTGKGGGWYAVHHVIIIRRVKSRLSYT